ncbi:hypothetical protein MNBD_GAMMA25-348 [hydrothermal vent metagenome]|uniref:Nitrous oxide reductase maturation protein, outer-membrane lipoprotein NosL n=1 Tax=hydrothermal vent metagenome TaxID=652676 RepID=A0A3B1AZF7_9ZZZZ
MKLFLNSMFALILLSACSEPRTGAIEPHWDRDTCERCRMVLSDRFHSAQVRFIDEKNKSRIRMFDDVGCAIIWLKDKDWRDAKSTEIWVNDHRHGNWINARTAFYVSGHNTSMEYGLGAQSESSSDSMDFLAAQKAIFDKENNNNSHGNHHH